MNRYRSAHSADEANLQADVMRFMAIIAFCLVAILAIVRNVEPAAESVTGPDPEPSPAAATSISSSSPEAPEATAITPVLTHPVEVAGKEKTTDPVAPDPILHAYEPPQQKPEAVPQPPAAVPPQVKNSVSAEAAAMESDPAPPQQTGLTLRFVSDSDFLRLLNKGTVTLYAISNSGFKRYDVAHRFASAQPPQQYYEVVDATVPGLIADLLKTRNVQWAVGLPGSIEQQINAHIERKSSGELLINRYAEVQHVAAR